MKIEKKTYLNSLSIYIYEDKLHACQQVYQDSFNNQKQNYTVFPPKTQTKTYQLNGWKSSSWHVYYTPINLGYKNINVFKLFVTSLTELKTGRPRCFCPPLPGEIPPTRLVPYSIACWLWKVPWCQKTKKETRLTSWKSEDFNLRQTWTKLNLFSLSLRNYHKKVAKTDFKRGKSHKGLIMHSYNHDYLFPSKALADDLSMGSNHKVSTCSSVYATNRLMALQNCEKKNSLLSRNIKLTPL